MTLTRAAIDAYSVTGDALSSLVAAPKQFSLHQDLDPSRERSLADLVAPDPSASVMAIHARTLTLVAGVLADVSRRDGADRYARLHPDDVTALYAIREALRTSTDGPPPPLEQIATDAGLSASKLKRGFRHLFGTSVYQYHLGARMDRARRLLDSGPVTVAAVSDQVGYSTPSHFSRAYRRRFGVSPLDSAQRRIRETSGHVADGPAGAGWPVWDGI